MDARRLTRGVLEEVLGGALARVDALVRVLLVAPRPRLPAAVRQAPRASFGLGAAERDPEILQEKQANYVQTMVGIQLVFNHTTQNVIRKSSITLSKNKRNTILNYQVETLLTQTKYLFQ